MEIPELYKYTSPHVARIVLETGRIRWSSPRTLNDPSEFRLAPIDRDLRERLIELSIEEAWKVFSGKNNPVTKYGFLLRALGEKTKFSRSEFVENFEGAISKSVDTHLDNEPAYISEIYDIMAKDKLLCLTDDPKNPVMWAHYAENGRGIVLGFRSIKLFDSPYFEARPVEYTASRPTIYTEEELAKTIGGSFTIDVSEAARRISHTKLDRWSYEREWRIYSGGGRFPDEEFEDLPFHPQELAKVIFGYQCPDDDRAQLTELARKKYDSVEFLQAQVSPYGDIVLVNIG